jgi:hypothetical protein
MLDILLKKKSMVSLEKKNEIDVGFDFFILEFMLVSIFILTGHQVGFVQKEK